MKQVILGRYREKRLVTTLAKNKKGPVPMDPEYEAWCAAKAMVSAVEHSKSMPGQIIMSLTDALCADRFKAFCPGALNYNCLNLANWPTYSFHFHTLSHIVLTLWAFVAALLAGAAVICLSV